MEREETIMMVEMEIDEITFKRIMRIRGNSYTEKIAILLETHIHQEAH